MGALLLAVLAGCAAQADSSGGAGPNAGTGSGGGTGAGGSSGGAAPGAGGSSVSTDGGVPLPPEMEIDSSFEVPVATGRFVWVANPTSGRVAYVDASSLVVRTVEAGNGPTYLAPLPGADDSVIVLNVLSNDATVLTATATGLASRSIPGIAPGSNSWAVSPDGLWAIAWTDARRVSNARSTQGFQDVTVIDLSAGKPTTLAVGFRPVSVSFAANSLHAFAVTQDGVTVLALGGAGGPEVTSNVVLGDDPTAGVDTRDVSITADGRLAVVRREGSAAVDVVDLGGGGRTTLTLSGPVTDVDVTADGARAVAVVRDTAEVVVIPLGGSLPASSALSRLTITGETVGQVVLTAGGGTAVLYSNATPAQRLTVVTLAATPSFRTIGLHAPVLSVFVAPDGRHAVALHPTETDPPANAPASPADGGADGGARADAGPSAPPTAGAFSLVPLDGTRTPRIEPTEAPIRAVAMAPASDRTLITLRDDAKRIYGVRMGLFPTLAVNRYQLASPPIAAGVVAAAARGYVAQKHPEGRITFLTLSSGDARTLTGYELASRVVDWSE